MQLLHDHPTLAVRSQKDSDVEVKERRSSNASLMMNPVASGDNVTTGLPSAHRLKEELPPLVPCCEGKELQINEDLVRSGLSAISVKHENVIHCLSSSEACERIQLTPGIVKRRNSYRCLHRPDLKRVPYLGRMTPDELESLFRGHADFPAWSQRNDNQDSAPRVMLPPDENILNRDLRTKEPTMADENGLVLHPIPEIRSGAEDVPAGMRLHGARARLYTSVQAVRAGDQRDCDSVNEALDSTIPEDLTEDEVQLKEELQIILPPRPDDVNADWSTTSNATSNTNS
ncbi:uncharacterized protein LOC133519357 isoform X2 [Cydia pomonella]|uniref:uncharacterized protein LOC133519357 isoform X2 n=1 Tax=Cydia pomonella TaxID=82600 RepID=UPI002ADE8108|nr:uncharacterized protein LOC133519357 isoform X2 [Cydia pomonella]